MLKEPNPSILLALYRQVYIEVNAKHLKEGINMVKVHKAVYLGLVGASLVLPMVAMAEQDEASQEIQKTHAPAVEKIVVLGSRLASGIGLEDQVSSYLSHEDIEQFNKHTVGDALGLLSGVTLSQNSRNESLITVRGFDSRQVPLYMDGIPIYVPYDGYIDFNRFTTADLAGIQVAKGFSSLAYGPNTLGGAINLISRKPTQALEGDVTAGVGAENHRYVSANLGMRQGQWFMQASASHAQSDGFRLSKDFTPVETEDGGRRDNSYFEDNKLSFKVGYLPVAGGEHFVGVYRQKGEKGQPPSTDADYARFWQWPFWDKEGVYAVSRTLLNELDSLTVRVYHDKYGNEVNSFTDNTYEELKTSGKGSVGEGQSTYHDKTTGGSLFFETTRLDSHHIKLVSHFKKDSHLDVSPSGQLNSDYEDKLFSVGVEDNVVVGDQLTLSLGLSKHWLKPETVYSHGNDYTLPSKKSATDMQAGLFYELNQDSRLYATVASKTRLPSLKDRYSQRLGRFVENPDLQAEEAVNYELGYQWSALTGTQIEAAVFFSSVTNKIQEVADVVDTLSQMQNIGKVDISGVELSTSTALSEVVAVGGNYTYTHIKNKDQDESPVTYIPKHKALAYAQWQPIDALEFQVQAEYNSSRIASATTTLSSFTVLNTHARYFIQPNLVWTVGFNNLLDKNYELSDGFPMAGRSWFTQMRWAF